MIYAVSDIHGCYEQYKELLNKTGFSGNDTLYVLGDVLDRGPEPIQILADITSSRSSAIMNTWLSLS